MKLEPTQNKDDVLDIWTAIGQKPRQLEIRAWWESLTPDKKQQAALETRSDNNHETLLHWAAITDQANTLNFLAAGADVNALDDRGCTPLDWLTQQMFFLICDEENRNPEIRDAVTSLSIMTGTALINHGGKADNPLQVFATAACWPLVEAWINQYPENKKFIAPQQFNLWHYWPSSLFKTGFDRTLWAKELQRHAIDINHEDSRGLTPWYAAVEYFAASHQSEILREILEFGADPIGKTVLAKKQNKLQMQNLSAAQQATVQILIKNR